MLFLQSTAISTAVRVLVPPNSNYNNNQRYSGVYIEYGCSDHYVDLPRNLADGAVCVCLLIWFVVVLVAKIRLGPDGTAHVLVVARVRPRAFCSGSTESNV